MAFEVLFLGENRPAVESVLRALQSDPRLATTSLRLADDTLGGRRTTAHNQERVLQERCARFRVAAELHAARWPNRAFAAPLLVEHLDCLAGSVPGNRDDSMATVWEHLIDHLHEEQALVWISGGAVESRRVADWRTIAGTRPILVVDAKTIRNDRDRFLDHLEHRLDWPEAESPLGVVEPPVVLQPSKRPKGRGTPVGDRRAAPKRTTPSAR